MTRKAFWIGGWAALVLGTLVALAAATVLVIGTLALTGRVTYPVDISVGPFSVQDEVSLPVSAGEDICQKASTRKQPGSRDCLRFFMHDGDGSEGPVHVQDADVRPTTARLTGTVALTTTGGWSPLVATSVARKAVGLTVISAVLLLLWRLLANSAAGNVFSARAVSHVRGIGWLLIVGSLVNLALTFAASFADGYEIVEFGSGPYLDPMSEAGIQPAQVVLGGLILLLAEAFRHGAAVEAEHRLTV